MSKIPLNVRHSFGDLLREDILLRSLKKENMGDRLIESLNLSEINAEIAEQQDLLKSIEADLLKDKQSGFFEKMKSRCHQSLERDFDNGLLMIQLMTEKMEELILREEEKVEK